jgi:hypothetical protein
MSYLQMAENGFHVIAAQPINKSKLQTEPIQ